MRSWRWLEGIRRDLRFAARALRRTPGFTIVAIASLSIGLALTAVTAAAVNAYLIESLPYPDADRLYRVRYAPPGPWEPRGMSSLDWSSVNDVVEFPMTSASETFYLSDGAFAQSARGLRVGRGFIEGLDVRAAPGRTFEAVDFAPASGEQPALIGYALWRDRYGADPNVIGRLLRVEAERAQSTAEVVRIVGVLPRDFYFGRDSSDRVDLLVPLTSAARTYMVKLRPDVPVEAAEQRITEAARQVGTEVPADWTGVELESVRELYVGQLRPVLVGVTAACGLVLIIVCANVAVLVLLRTLRRQRELAVRAALGSGRWLLARMLLFEAGLLCAAAIALGLALAAITLDTLSPLVEAQLGRPAPRGASAMSIDLVVLLIVASLGMVVAFVVSFLPLLTPWQRRLADALRRDRTTGAGGRPLRHMRSTLIALEIAGTLVLLVACGLMVRAAVAMLRTDLGFEPDHLVRARVVLRGSDYADAAAFSRFYRQFTNRLSTAISAPVVFTSWPAFIELPNEHVEVPGRPGQGIPAGAIRVSSGYFGAFGIALHSGRDFTDADTSSANPVVGISETLARRLWTDGNALGRQLRVVEPTPEGPRAGPWRTVIAVAHDVRQTYEDVALADVYTPWWPSGRFGSFHARTERAPAALLPEIRAIASAMDPRAMIDPPKSVAGENRQLAGTRFLTLLLGGFAGVATFLAILGIYGVTAYAVTQRERETAIRIALGAPAAAVVWLFLKESGMVVAAGLTLGVFGATVASRTLASQAVGVRTFDVPTLLMMAAMLASVAAVATWWPARCASRRNPLGALKES